MPLIFRKSAQNSKSRDRNTVSLQTNNWDDYSFKTTFYATLNDDAGKEYDLGEVKIGYAGQPHGSTAQVLPHVFSELEEGYFSLGQSVEYYSKLREVPVQLRNDFLKGIRDVVFDVANLNLAKEERVFRDSLLRGVNFSTISEQFKRVLDGGAILTEFHFCFRTEATQNRAGFDLRFDVIPNALPSNNIHVLIGRNGTGKTTLLNNMIAALVGERPLPAGGGQFLDFSTPVPTPITQQYFSGVVSVSFSAFDPFTPPLDRDGELKELRYSYIGLKRVFMDDAGRRSEHKTMPELGEDFVSSLIGCFGIATKRERWEKSIGYLESDLNFQEMDLRRLLQIADMELFKQRAQSSFEKMSSGHAIVLLTITKLIERADEKTLVLIDEPESHLHPPLLSAFTRALADMLNTINGIAIIATHSPVVLQEVPRDCVWKMSRLRLAAASDRPEIETFAENVGILTREVFSLEVTTSGFHDLLSKSVEQGKTFEQIVEEYRDHIGFEGKAILRALISNRDRARGGI